MGGFATIDEGGVSKTTVYADNVDFSGTRVGTVTANGQLLIGSTASPHIRIGTLTSPGGTITIGYVSPNITLESVTASTVATTFNEDTGSAVPAANILNILGGPGVTTSGAGNTVTINSVVFTNTAAATLAVDNGYFATAAGTYGLPATATQGELIHIVADTAGAVVLDAPALNFIRVGTLITSSGGTATSTAIGDSLTLRYRLSSLTWIATAVQGTWVIA